MSVFTEAWANAQTAEATVTAGGTAPVAGPETWTMGGGFAQFPQADPALIPPSLFRVYDRDAPAEAILVTDTVTAPGAWQVTRGDQGTPALTHAPGFTVLSLLSPAGLAALAAGVPSRNGLDLPAAGLTGRQNWNDQNVRHTLARLPVPGGEAVPGSVYEASAWGVHVTRTGVTTSPRFGLDWDVQLAAATFTVPTTASNQIARWKVHAVVSILTPGNLATVGMAVWISADGAPDNPAVTATWVRRYMIGDPASKPVTTSTDQVMTLWHMTVAPNTQDFTLMGSKEWRSA